MIIVRAGVLPRSATLRFVMSDNALNHLRLLQLADSALPVGALAHSFGLETLVTLEVLTVPQLEPFLADYLDEVGALEGLFCRTAYRLAANPNQTDMAQSWLDLNRRISAFKPVRESRAASAMLGRRLLRLVLDLEALPPIERALAVVGQAGGDIHYSAAFGLAGGALGLDEEMTVLAYLHQVLAGLVSACQRLMPLGQSQASWLIWTLKPVLIRVAARSCHQTLEEDAVFYFTPLIDVGGMRHPMLTTRLFMS